MGFAKTEEDEFQWMTNFLSNKFKFFENYETTQI
jgi:hypothetical protein